MTTQTAPPGIPHEVWRAWWIDNPIHVWRKREGVKMMEVALVADCSMTQLQLYEHGIHPVPEDKVARLAPAMGISATGLARKFTTWRANDPRKNLVPA